MFSRHKAESQEPLTDFFHQFNTQLQKMPEKAAPGAFYAGLLFVLPFIALLFWSTFDCSSLVIALDWLAASYVGAYAASAQRRGGFYRVHFSDFCLRRR